MCQAKFTNSKIFLNSLILFALSIELLPILLVLICKVPSLHCAPLQILVLLVWIHVFCLLRIVANPFYMLWLFPNLVGCEPMVLLCRYHKCSYLDKVFLSLWICKFWNPFCFLHWCPSLSTLYTMRKVKMILTLACWFWFWLVLKNWEDFENLWWFLKCFIDFLIKVEQNFLKLSIFS